VADWDNGTTLSGGDAAKSSGGTKTWLDAGSKGHNGTILPAWPDFTLHPLAKGLQKLPPEKSTHGRHWGFFRCRTTNVKLNSMVAYRRASYSNPLSLQKELA
jgi:hypothetical protein